MSPKKPLLPYLSEQERTAAVQEVINFFATERDEEIGIIAAEDLLDMFLEVAGAKIYNKAVDDAKDTTQKHFEELKAELELTLKR